MNPEVPSPARRQSGVLTRGQALAAGLTAHQVRWRIEQGSWRTLHRGVYLTNAGVVTWSARAWAALLWAGPGGVLALEAAARVWRLQPDEPRIITVGVPAGHGTRTADGVRTVQRGRLASQRVDGLPVTRAAQTVLDLADRPGCSLDDAVALAARACHLGRATAQTLLADLRARGRHRHRAGLELALGEIGVGAESLPEVWFVTRVQRPHGLPEFERQTIETTGTRTDLKNATFGLNIEIDGRAWHAGERFHTDRHRDLLAVGRGEVTVRVTFQDLDTGPCRLAADLARALRARGWQGTARRCRSCRSS